MITLPVFHSVDIFTGPQGISLLNSNSYTSILKSVYLQLKQIFERDVVRIKTPLYMTLYLLYQYYLDCDLVRVCETLGHCSG